MGKPATRVGDTHICPKMNPGSNTPHVGGVITGPGNATVLIGGKAAATVGDSCTCESGEPNSIIKGSTGVFIGGKPAARKDDACAHGGSVSGGCGTVLIGERRAKREKWKEPSVKKKIKIVNRTIEDCIVVLEGRLKAMLEYDPQTYKDFAKWFGVVTRRKRDIIVKRIRSTLEVCRNLKIENFELVDIGGKENEFASVYRIEGNYPSIRLGIRFWKIENDSGKSRAGVVIHELSHFRNIGNTDDFAYGSQACLGLAKYHPHDAMYNADSYELFMAG